MTSNTFPSSSSADRLAALFDGAETGGSQRPWWRRRRRAGFVAVGIALLLVVLLATNAFGSDSTDYRTAVVEEHDVDSLLTGVATIEPVSQATVAFPVSGTVSTVNVKVGDQVAVGQTLATLDAQSLIDTFHTEEAAMAQAKLNLSKALSGQSVGAGGGGARRYRIDWRQRERVAQLDQQRQHRDRGPDGGHVHGHAARVTPAGSRRRAASRRRRARRVEDRARQRDVGVQHGRINRRRRLPDRALRRADRAERGRYRAAQAGRRVDRARQLPQREGVGTDHHALDDARHRIGRNRRVRARRVNRARARAVPADSAARGAARAHRPRPTSPRTRPRSTRRPRTSRPPTRRSARPRSRARSRAPWSPPASLLARPSSAASTTANVVVQGAGGFEVTTSVDVNKISNVAVGQAATLVADGSHTALPGKVTSLSVAPTSTSGAATSYRVVVGLDNPNEKLGNGSTGTVTIVTKSAKAALAVPTSALTPVGSRYTVNVLEDGTTKTVVVNVGVVGTERTEITSGLTKGQEVVLADVSEPLPSSATSSSNGTTGGTTGFPGGAGAFRIPSGARPGG